MEALLVEIIFLVVFFGYVISYNRTDDIVFELGKMYYSPTELRNAVVKHLKAEGKKCKAINDTTLIVNSSKYTVTETKITAYGVPVQRVTLKKVEMNIRVITNES